MRRRQPSSGPPTTNQIMATHLFLITGLFLLLLVGLGAPNARADFDFEFLGEFGHKISVVPDKGDHYHISHIRYESRSSWLKYSTNASGSWVTERLAYASGSRSKRRVVTSRGGGDLLVS